MVVAVHDHLVLASEMRRKRRRRCVEGEGIAMVAGEDIEGHRRLKETRTGSNERGIPIRRWRGRGWRWRGCWRTCVDGAAMVAGEGLQRWPALVIAGGLMADED